MEAQILRIGDDIVAVHAIVTDDGVTLIDAGLPGDLDLLRDALAGVGRSPEDLRGVVLTHGDSDHIGIAERLRAEYGVPVHIHEADAAQATGAAPAPSGSAGRWRLGPTLRFLWVAARRGALRTRHIAEVVRMQDGDVLDLPGRPEIIAIPGHSPGSVAIRVPSVDALFLGDAVTTRNVLSGERGMLLAPFSVDHAQTRRSLERLRGLPEARIFPGHGPEFRGGVSGVLAAVA